MCGIFGYIGSLDHRLNMRRLEQIAVDTQTRGPHSFGFAWLDRRGRLKAFKQTGRIADHLGLLQMASDAVVLIGHCRWATHGSYHDQINNHPFACNGGWLVHNGVVGNYAEILERHELHAVSECDTESLALLIEDLDGPPLQRVAETVAISQGPLALSILWSRPQRLVLARRGNPIWLSTDSAGRQFFASRPDALPGNAKPLPDDHVQLIRFNARKAVERVVHLDVVERDDEQLSPATRRGAPTRSLMSSRDPGFRRWLGKRKAS